MLEIHKNIVVDENQKPVTVQTPFDEFQRIEEVIENFGLAKLMDETESDERLAGDAAKEYYEALLEKSCLLAKKISNNEQR